MRRLAGAGALLLSCEGLAASNGGLRPITVEDVVRETVIGDPHSLTWNDYYRRDHISVTSPDGRHIAVVLRNGNVEEETNHGRLLVFESATLVSNPQPQLLAEFSSATNYQPIALVRWLSDSRTLVFAGTDGSAPSQIYEANLSDGRVQAISKESGQLTWYEIDDAGTRLVTLVKPALSRTGDRDDCRRRGCRVNADRLVDAESGTTGAQNLNAYQLDRREQESIPAPEEVFPDIERCGDELIGGISPNGRFVVRVCYSRPYQWPTWWSEYTADPQLQTFLTDGNNKEARWLFLIDLDTRQLKPLTRAPFFYDQAAPVWVDGGHRVLLAGSLESLEGQHGEERKRRTSGFAIVSVELPSLRATRVAVLDKAVLRVTQARWNSARQELTIDTVDVHRKALPEEIYRRVRGRIQFERVVVSAASAAALSPDRAGVSVSVVQSLNDRPVLKAIDQATGRTSIVLDPNPWLKDRELSHVKAIGWTTPGPRTWKGGIYFPPGFREGVRYPLVIQTHGFDAGTFALSGVARNFVAQPLAARGIVVLQMSENLNGVVGTPKEWPTVEAGIEGVIDYLDGKGLIDRNRVGIVGWSRTGPHMGYVITHSDYPFAAGAFTDTAGFGLWGYRASGESSSSNEMEADYGTAPFGIGLKAWLEQTPDFSFDRVRTPLMMCASGSAIGLWEWFSGMRRLDSPVEYWVMPDGVHDVFKVGERLRENHLLVDWFDFWLNKHENSTSATSEQYKRWRQLREQQTKLLTRPRPPLLEWRAVPKN